MKFFEPHQLSVIQLGIAKKLNGDFSRYSDLDLLEIKLY